MTADRMVLLSRVALALLIILATVLLLKNGGNWLEQIDSYSWNLKAAELILSALLLAVSLSLTPAGWVLVSKAMGAQLPAKQMFAAWYASQLGRYVPGKIWLFAGRTGFLKANGMKVGRAAATVAYELFFSVASVGLLVLVLVVFSPEVFHNTAGRSAALIAAVAVLLLPLLHPVQRFFCRKKGIDPEVLPGVRLSFYVTLLYVFLWLVRGISLFLLLRGVGLTNIRFTFSLAAAPLSWLAGYVVFFVPGGIGVREAAAAAIAVPESVAPAAVVIAGQRLYMALIEILLALLGMSVIKFGSNRED